MSADDLRIVPAARDIDAIRLAAYFTLIGPAGWIATRSSASPA